MELLFFIILLLGMLAFIGVGLSKGNFPLTFIGSVLCIVLGLMVLTSGLSTQKIVDYEVDDSNSTLAIITPEYETFTADLATNPEIWVMGNLMLFGGMIFLLIASYYAAFGNLIGKNNLEDG